MAAASQASTPTFENHATLPIAIVGGGLCGLALAIGLIKHGINVQIFEAAPAFSEIGAGVAFGVNSIIALQLIDQRLLEGYKKHATFNADRARDSEFYTMRWGVDERKEDGSKAGDFGWTLNDDWYFARTRELGVRTRSCIHRARLLEELVALLPQGITTFGKSFESTEELADGTLKLWFADGTTTLASALIGCDGIKSRVRKLVCSPAVRPQYAGEVAYRAVVPRADAEAALGAEFVLNGHIYCGYSEYIITYPIEHGELVNMVAIPQDRDGRGVAEWKGDEWTVPGTKDEFLKRFEGWYKPLIVVFARYHLPSKWALFVLQHDEPYCKDRICLTGDAAHATVPHLGAGAGMAMEDAYVLSSLVASVGNVKHIGKAFRAYDAVRRPRSQECLKRSLEVSLCYGLGTEEVGNDVEVLKQRLEESFKWLWGGDLQADVIRAKELVRLDKR